MKMRPAPLKLTYFTDWPMCTWKTAVFQQLTLAFVTNAVGRQRRHTAMTGPARPRFPKGRGIKDPPFGRWMLYGAIHEFGDAAGSEDTRFLDNRHTRLEAI